MPIDLNLVLAGLSLAIFLGLIGFFAYLMRHQRQMEPKEPEIEGVELLRQHYAPGETIEQPTPYFVAPIPASPDPLEISANLDKKIVAGAGMIFAVFALIGGYFLVQPSIRVAGVERQQEQAAHRGRNLYANLCFDCHGKEGKGDVGVGLPLNKPEFKYDNIKADPAKLKDTEKLIRQTIERGRPKPGGISMPAWSLIEGGPLNDEQILQLLTFIEHGTDAEWKDVVTVRTQSGLEPEPHPPTVAAATPVDHGKAIASTVCTSCHSFDPSKPSPVSLAPNLGEYGAKGPFNDQNKAAKASGDPEWLLKWVSNAPKVKPGIIMPMFAQSQGGSISDADIKDIVTYLESLGKGSTQ